MEVRVEAVESCELPANSYINVFIGDVAKRKPHIPACSQHYVFPEAKQVGKVDIVQRIGTCDLVWGADGPETKLCALQGADGDTGIRLRLSLSRLDPQALVEASKSKTFPLDGTTTSSKLNRSSGMRSVKAKETSLLARKFLAQHGVEKLLAEATRALVKVMPPEPRKFLADYILAGGSAEAMLPEAIASRELQVVGGVADAAGEAPPLPAAGEEKEKQRSRSKDPRSVLEAARRCRLLQLGVSQQALEASELCRLPPPPSEDGAGSNNLRVMQFNLLADGLAEDGFLVRPVLDQWPAGSLGSLPTSKGEAVQFSEMLREMMASSQGRSMTLRRSMTFKEKYDVPALRSNFAAVVDWQARLLQIQLLVLAACPDILVLEELDHYAEVAAGLQELGYSSSTVSSSSTARVRVPYSPAHLEGHSCQDAESANRFCQDVEAKGHAFLPHLHSMSLFRALKRKGLDEKILGAAEALGFREQVEDLSAPGTLSRYWTSSLPQEFSGGSAALLRAAGVDDPGLLDDMGVGVFWRSDRFTAEGLRARVYQCGRGGLLQVQLKEISSGRRVTVLGSHLSSGDSLEAEQERVSQQILGEQGEGLAKWAREARRDCDSLILALDANSYPQICSQGGGSSSSASPCCYQLLHEALGASVWDSYLDATGAPATTKTSTSAEADGSSPELLPPVSCNKVRGPLSEQVEKIGAHACHLIDHIFYTPSGFEMRSHVRPPSSFASETEAIENVQPSLANPSDHYPVIVDLFWQPRESEAADKIEKVELSPGDRPSLILARDRSVRLPSVQLYADRVVKRASLRESARLPVTGERADRALPSLEEAALAQTAEEELNAAMEEAAEQLAEEEAARKALEEEALRKQAEAAAKGEIEEEASRKMAEEEAAHKRLEEEAARKAREEASHRQAEAQALREKLEQETARKLAEEEAARKQAEEEALKVAIEEEARRIAEEQAAHQAALPQLCRKRSDMQSAQRAAEEETVRKVFAEANVRKQAEKQATHKFTEEDLSRGPVDEKVVPEAPQQEKVAHKLHQEDADGKAMQKVAAPQMAKQQVATNNVAEEELAQKLAEKDAAQKPFEEKVVPETLSVIASRDMQEPPSTPPSTSLAKDRPSTATPLLSPSSSARRATTPPGFSPSSAAAPAVVIFQFTLPFSETWQADARRLIQEHLTGTGITLQQFDTTRLAVQDAASSPLDAFGLMRGAFAEQHFPLQVSYLKDSQAQRIIGASPPRSREAGDRPQSLTGSRRRV